MNLKYSVILVNVAVERETGELIVCLMSQRKTISSLSLIPFNAVAVLSQVFDNTPAALDGTLAAGDEITGVNGKPVKGKTKVEVAKMIQAVQVLGL